MNRADTLTDSGTQVGTQSGARAGSASCPKCSSACNASDAEVVRGVLWMRCPTCFEMFEGTWAETLEDAEPTLLMVESSSQPRERELVFVRTPFGPKLVDSSVSNEPTISVPLSEARDGTARDRTRAPSQRPTAPPPGSADLYEELDIPVPSAPLSNGVTSARTSGVLSDRGPEIEQAIASALYARSVPMSSKPLSLAESLVLAPPTIIVEDDPVTSLEVETRVLGRVPRPEARTAHRPIKQYGKLALACLVMAVLVVLFGLALHRVSSARGSHAGTASASHPVSG